MAIQPDGKLIIFGTRSAVGATDGDGNYTNKYAAFGMVRLDSGGAVDTSFGSGGYVTTLFPRVADFGEQAVVLTDGHILVVGGQGEWNYEAQAFTDMAVAIAEVEPGAVTLPVSVVTPPQATYLGAGGGGSPSSSNGFSPAQICTAYGITALDNFEGITTAGSTPDAGQGQTIAIIVGNDDPDIVTDLNTFDSNSNLPPPPSFEVLNQLGQVVRTLTSRSGSGTPPSQDSSGTAEHEASLNVSGPMRLPPDANIIMVEADSGNFDDLIGGAAKPGAVQIAREQPGVSVISMSFGEPEIDLGSAAENWWDTNCFATPSGHRPITFVAASGDTGRRHRIHLGFQATANRIIYRTYSLRRR